MRRVVPIAQVALLVLTSVASAQTKLPPGVKLTSAAERKELWDKYFKDAKVGDFIEFVGLGSKEPTRQEIIEVGKNYVVELQTRTSAGKKSQTATKIFFKDLPGTLPPDRRQKKKSQVKIKIGDKEVNAELVQTISAGKVVQKEWISKEVPYWHLPVKWESNGKVTREVLKFGRGS